MHRTAPAHQDKGDNTGKDRQDGDREDGDSSYRLPLAAPCSSRPLHHHSITLHTRRTEVGVRRGASAAVLPPTAPCPGDSPCLLWAPGPQHLPARKKDGEMLQGCAVGAGEGAVPPWGPQSPGVHCSPPGISSPQGPLPCPHAPPGSQASPVGERRGVVREDPSRGCSQGRGVLTTGPRSPSGPGRPSSPCEKKGMGKKGLGWGHPQCHPTLGTGVVLTRCALEVAP